MSLPSLPSSPETSFLDRTLVLIPALDEEGSVGATIRAWIHLGAGIVRVVDNGSTDSTAAVALEAGAEVVHEPGKGYGAACWKGLESIPSFVEWVLFSSADGSDRLDEADVRRWQREIEAGAALLVGDRYSLLESRRNLKWTQVFGNRLCCYLILLGWGRRFRDIGSLRLIRLEDLRRLGLRDRGFGWNIEMQVRSIEHGLRIVELNVPYAPRLAGRSKISGSISGTVRAAFGMIRMFFHLWRSRTD